MELLQFCVGAIVLKNAYPTFKNNYYEHHHESAKIDMQSVDVWHRQGSLQSLHCILLGR